MPHVPARGFTLIELLVVIAIIGMLSAIVMASLSGARASGADAAVRGNLNTVRTQAEVYAIANNGGYGTLAATPTTCHTQTSGSMFADPTIRDAMVKVNANAGGALLQGLNPRSVLCVATPNTWAIAVVLKSDTNTLYCVDSTGRAKTIARTFYDAVGETFTACLP